MTEPAAADQLQVGEVMAELGLVHTELAANGANALCAELAQRRVIERSLRRRIDELEQGASGV